MILSSRDVIAFGKVLGIKNNWLRIDTCDSFSTDSNLFLSARRSVQKAHENQFVNSPNGVLFTCVKYQERIRTTRMLNAIAASEDTLSF